MGSSFCVWGADQGTLVPAPTSCATTTTIARASSAASWCGGSSALIRAPNAKTRPHKPGVDPRGTQKKSDGPWRGWLVPRGPKKYQGWSDFFRDFFIVFLNSPHRETPKNVIKKIEKKSVLDFFVDFFEKLFDTIFWQNVFCSVF